MFLWFVLFSITIVNACYFNTKDYEGEEASVGNYSYMGVLTVKKLPFIPYQKRCVSILVSSEYAVTTASCARSFFLESRTLTYGCSDLREPDCNTLQLQNRAIIHPDYMKKADNDIAVFRIEKPVKNENLIPVELPESSNYKPKGNGTLLFWASSRNEYLRNILRELKVSVTKCNNKLASKTTFCVGNLKSPQYIEKGSAFVIGSTLYGVLREYHGDQLAFTNVASVVGFINKTAELQ